MIYPRVIRVGEGDENADWIKRVDDGKGHEADRVGLALALARYHRRLREKAGPQP